MQYDFNNICQISVAYRRGLTMETMNFSRNSAPDCRGCKYYWNNRNDSRYIDTVLQGYSARTYETDDGIHHSVRKVKYKHGCKLFDFSTSIENLPSLFIYNRIGKHCPMVVATHQIEKSGGDHTKMSPFDNDHKIDIKI
jgi:hypothetical protein